MDTKKGLYGYASGFVAAALLQPLENIKMVIILPPDDVKLTNNFLKNIKIATSYLTNDQGLKSFYKGLLPNVVKTGFSSSIYFSSLRFCESIDNRPNENGKRSMVASFFNSLTARVISAIASNPLSVVETRFQYAGKQRWTGGIVESLLKIYKMEGFQGFFKGCLASCYKEGVFSGLYYAMYTEGKHFGINSFLAGITSGVIATAITHPFEIIRAELQADMVTHDQIKIKQSLLTQLTILFQKGEALKGVAPRLIKKPLVNTTSFVMFEMLERSEQSKP